LNPPQAALFSRPTYGRYKEERPIELAPSPHDPETVKSLTPWRLPFSTLGRTFSPPVPQRWFSFVYAPGKTASFIKEQVPSRRVRTMNVPVIS